MRQNLAAALIVAIALAWPAQAFAEDNAADRATARALAGEGYAALKKKDFATAEDRFRRADELIPAPTLVVDHARALVGLGRVGDAYTRLQSVVNAPVPPKAPWVWTKAVKDAQRDLAELESRVAWLTIVVRGPSEPHVELDGRPFPAAALGVRRATDPGERTFAVSADGFIPREEKLELTAGQESSLEIDLQPVPKPEPVVIIAPPPPASAATRRRERSNTPIYVAYGVGAVGIATGAVAGILWLKTRSDVRSACGGLKCDPKTDSQQARFKDDEKRYNTFGTISGVGFGVGIVGALVGTGVLIFRSNDDGTGEAQARGTWRPYIGPDQVGVRGTFQ